MLGCHNCISHLAVTLACVYFSAAEKHSKVVGNNAFNKQMAGMLLISQLECS